MNDPRLSEHKFHIPVMGTGHSVDTPIRVAHFGITSVISLVDDILLERVRQYYHKLYNWPFTPVAKDHEDRRAAKTTEYLNTVLKIVQLKMDHTKALPFYEDNDKAQYFEMLPDESELKGEYERLLKMSPGAKRDDLEIALTERMKPGAIDVNLMLKLDVDRFDKQGNALGVTLRDIYSSLRGYAVCKLDSSIVFSAGINKGLYNYMTQFKDFYRDVNGYIRKKIILKVSDFRSSQIQGKYLAKKGLEIGEFRVESGLNCGGHAFPMGGLLMPQLMHEFKEKRSELGTQFLPTIKKYYDQEEMPFIELENEPGPLITVQGGIGEGSEAKRLLTEYGVDRTGWATPFLLVPEATLVDKPTLEQLIKAKEENLYLSDASPLGIPFNNLRFSGSHKYTMDRVAKGTPGSPCPKGFVRSNTEFTDQPICLASRHYQKLKIDQINAREDLDAEGKSDAIADVVIKECICDHLGNGALIALELADPAKKPQSICPGPNIAWFDKTYSLRQMVDYIYGRGPMLVPAERPHMFLKELTMNVEFVEKLMFKTSFEPREISFIQSFKKNLATGVEYCRTIANGKQYGRENLSSLRDGIDKQVDKLEELFNDFDKLVEARKEEPVLA